PLYPLPSVFSHFSSFLACVTLSFHFLSSVPVPVPLYCPFPSSFRSISFSLSTSFILASTSALLISPSFSGGCPERLQPMQQNTQHRTRTINLFAFMRFLVCRGGRHVAHRIPRR